jgi:hypothetical protein
MEDGILNFSIIIRARGRGTDLIGCYGLKKELMIPRKN